MLQIDGDIISKYIHNKPYSLVPINTPKLSVDFVPSLNQDFEISFSNLNFSIQNLYFETTETQKELENLQGRIKLNKEFYKIVVETHRLLSNVDTDFFSLKRAFVHLKSFEDYCFYSDLKDLLKNVLNNLLEKQIRLVDGLFSTFIGSLGGLGSKILDVITIKNSNQSDSWKENMINEEASVKKPSLNTKEFDDLKKDHKNVLSSNSNIRKTCDSINDNIKEPSRSKSTSNRIDDIVAQYENKSNSSRKSFNTLDIHSRYQNNEKHTNNKNIDIDEKCLSRKSFLNDLNILDSNICLNQKKEGEKEPSSRLQNHDLFLDKEKKNIVPDCVDSLKNVEKDSIDVNLKSQNFVNKAQEFVNHTKFKSQYNYNTLKHNNLLYRSSNMLWINILNREGLQYNFSSIFSTYYIYSLFDRKEEFISYFTRKRMNLFHVLQFRQFIGLLLIEKKIIQKIPELSLKIERADFKIDELKTCIQVMKILRLECKEQEIKLEKTCFDYILEQKIKVKNYQDLSDFIEKCNMFLKDCEIFTVLEYYTSILDMFYVKYFNEVSLKENKTNLCYLKGMLKTEVCSFKLEEKIMQDLSIKKENLKNIFENRTFEELWSVEMCEDVVMEIKNLFSRFKEENELVKFYVTLRTKDASLANIIEPLLSHK